MDPFHVVRLAGDALDRCRRRVQQDLHGHRGPHRRPALLAPDGPCTPAPTCSPTSRRHRLTALFAVDEHVEVEATWGIYQRMIAAYRDPDRSRGTTAMTSPDRLAQHAASRQRLTELRTPRPDPEASAPPTCWPTSTGPAPATAPPRRSTADSNTSAAPPSASATSPTTSPAACSRPAASDPDYTLDCDEPGWRQMRLSCGRRVGTPASGRQVIVPQTPTPRRYDAAVSRRRVIVTHARRPADRELIRPRPCRPEVDDAEPQPRRAAVVAFSCRGRRSSSSGCACPAPRRPSP